MSMIFFSISVEQTFSNGKSEDHLLSTSCFHESIPLSSIFSSFEHQVKYWLEQEAQTESSFRFSLAVTPSNSDL